MISARVLLWIVLSVLLAIMLNPLVDRFERRVHCRRSISVAAVMAGLTLVCGALGFIVVNPLVSEGTNIATNLPTFLEDARAGKGTAGNLVKRFNLDENLSEEKLREFGRDLTTGSFSIAKEVGNALAAIVTILTLTILLLAEGPRLVAAVGRQIPPKYADRAARVGRECARSVSGYMAGNLLISVVAGTMSFTFLTIADVPFAGVLAVWVALTDLIPLVGAVLGAAVTVLIAFIDSPGVGIAALIFFLLYQVFENNVLQVGVMSRTVKLDPLSVLIAMLLGIELLGFVGAFVAIPFAGILQVVIRDLWGARQLRLQTVAAGADQPAPM